MYLPEIRNPVDYAVSSIITKHKENLFIPLIQVDKGYLVGSDIR
jgi:hypothetical protein